MDMDLSKDNTPRMKKNPSSPTTMPSSPSPPPAKAHNQLAQYGEQAIGWVFSVYVFLSFFCGVQIGPVFDAHGPRWILAVGTVCLLLSAFLMGECTGEFAAAVVVFGDVGCVILTGDGQSTGTS
jgi:MFS family permease